MGKIERLLLSIMLIIALFLGNSPYVLAQESTNSEFSDIKNHWAEAVIGEFVNKGYINGYDDNTFRPNDSIKRAEFIKLVNQYFGFSEKGESAFIDVDEESWYYEDVLIATNKGYINGYDDNTFKPENNITREEACKIIGTILNISSDGITKFKDNSSISSWAVKYVDGLIDKGIIRGYSDNTFKPQNHITRAESVKTIYSINSPDKGPIEEEKPPTDVKPPVEEEKPPQNILLNVPVINQHKSGLKYGCEAMATLMALEYKSGKDFDNYKFGIEMPMDKTKVKTTNGYKGVYQWGDPEVGFVGDITGKSMGSTVYAKPLTDYVKRLGYNAIDLTGSSFETILNEVRKGNPVVAWVSLNMNTPNDWSYWKTPAGKKIRVTFSAHSVTITGVDDKYVYYNDSWTGSKNKKISKSQFEKVYNWRGKRALTII